MVKMNWGRPQFRVQGRELVDVRQEREEMNRKPAKRQEEPVPKEFDETNKGVLFNNQDEKKTDRHPDYRGNVNVEGVDYWVSGWLQTSRKTGVKFLSLKIKAKNKEVVAQPTAGNGVQPTLGNDLNDEIPF